MSESDFPIALIDLIRRSAPSFPAVELLVFVASKPETAWSIPDLVESLGQRAMKPAAMADYISLYDKGGLIEKLPDNRFRYAPSTPERADSVKLLIAAFNERPVSLIRTVYALADHSIQSFADSFRLRND